MNKKSPQKKQSVLPAQQNPPNNPKGHKIPIYNAFDDFKRHFLTPNNSNIVLSGGYGSGKSYFLKEFTTEQELASKYNFVTLYPVNYVVSSNEDIFDLFKVDIIRSLCVDGLIDVSKSGHRVFKSLAVKEYLFKRPIQLLKHISSAFSSVIPAAGFASSLSDSYLKILDDFAKFEDGLNDKIKNEGTRLEEFASNYMQNKPGYLENNIITQMIVSQLAENKTKSKKENVLIIEDVDRLDPAHIFRLFNILSAHQTGETTNKFGFDKVIVVCDLDNVEKIYKHFYGADTEFSGYIGKFYSYAPFPFDIKQSISSHLNGVLNVNLPPNSINVLVELMKLFLRSKLVNLRTILHTNYLASEQRLNIHYFTLSGETANLVHRNLPHIKSDEIRFNSNDLEMLGLLRVLGCLFRGYDKLDVIFTEFSGPAYNKPMNLDDGILTLLAQNNYFINAYQDHNLLFYHRDRSAGQYRLPAYSMGGSEKFAMNTRWTGNSNYDGTVSFFNDVRVSTIDQNPKKVVINYNFIFGELQKSLTFYRDRGYLMPI